MTSDVSVPAEISAQLSMARHVLERHLPSTLMAVYLYGSALEGGLKPQSDIDLLVVTTTRLDEKIRQALLVDLLSVSAPPRQTESKALRSLDVTIVVQNDIIPWRYPARRELQFGEWLRREIAAGVFECADLDVDLAIILTKTRQHSVALTGAPAERFFEPVPEHDFFAALNDTLKVWNSPPDWAGDERNVVLTLARIWYSAATGKIAPKHVAADWASMRLPVDLRPLVLEARQAYLGLVQDRLACRTDRIAALVRFVKGETATLLNAGGRPRVDETPGKHA
ncbi:MAG: AadA family aminoglycoside 3''-O-nucleotidyltransferase [Limnochordia bacterium]|jgi:streptomycin 3"-adenylyltransferase